MYGGGRQCETCDSVDRCTEVRRAPLKTATSYGRVWRKGVGKLGLESVSYSYFDWTKEKGHVAQWYGPHCYFRAAVTCKQALVVMIYFVCLFRFKFRST